MSIVMKPLGVLFSNTLASEYPYNLDFTMTPVAQVPEQPGSQRCPRHPILIAGVEASSTVIPVFSIVPTRLLCSRHHLTHRFV